MKIEETQYQSLVCLRLENDFLLAEFLPEIGGKMIRLHHKISGRELLLPSQLPNGQYRIPEYGDLYENYDTSGFDECFPTIEACEVEEEGGQMLSWPDHGEVWAQPWSYQIQNNGVLFSVQGRALNYRLFRFVTLQAQELLFQYRLENRSGMGFHYIWAAHPLIRVSPGSRIVLPEEVNQVFINWATPPQLGEYGELRPWPLMDGKDLSVVQDRRSGIALKCFTNPLNRGQAQITFPESQEVLAIEFEPEENPYLGIWITYGGWPGYSSRKHLTVGLEPTSGRPDSLARAMERGECRYLPPETETRWDLHLRVETIREKHSTFHPMEQVHHENRGEMDSCMD